jgi:hypothetical protein
MSQSPKERMPEEDDTTEAPLTMAASVVLTNLPKDTSKALETAGSLAVQKGILDCFSIHLYYGTGIHQRYHPLRNSPSPSHCIPPTSLSFLALPPNSTQLTTPLCSHRDNSNSTHFQAWHKLDVCNDSAVPPETTRCQGARECVLLRGECV